MEKSLDDRIGAEMSSRRSNWMIVLVFISVLLVASCGQSASAGGGTQVAASDSQLQLIGSTNLPGISVVGRGVVNARPDVALVDLGVEVVDTDANEAFSENTTRMKAVMDVLKATEVKEQDIQTISYNMWIEQVYDRDEKQDHPPFRAVDDLHEHDRIVYRHDRLPGLASGLNI